MIKNIMLWLQENGTVLFFPDPKVKKIVTKDIKEDRPLWSAACNGISFHSPNGYYCDGGVLSLNEEMEKTWDNRNKILKFIETLMGKQKSVTVKEVAHKLNLTDEFVFFVLESEFDELE